MKTRRRGIAYTFDPSINVHNKYQRDLRRALKASLKDVEEEKKEVPVYSELNDTNGSLGTTPSGFDKGDILEDSNGSSHSLYEESSKSSQGKTSKDSERPSLRSTQPLPLTRRRSIPPINITHQLINKNKSINENQNSPPLFNPNKSRKRTRNETRNERTRNETKLASPTHNSIHSKRTRTRSKHDSMRTDPYYRTLYQRELKKAMKESMNTFEKEAETQKMEKESMYKEFSDESSIPGNIETSSVSSSVCLSEEGQDNLVGNVVEVSCATTSSASFSALGCDSTSSFASCSESSKGPQHPSSRNYNHTKKTCSFLLDKKYPLPSNILTHLGFLQLWKKAEMRLGLTLEDVENNNLIRCNNNHRDKRNNTGLSNNQTRAMYGRTTFSGMEEISKLADLKRNEIFLDIGHGLGNAVLQAAFTVGCEARGLEVVPERCRIADQYHKTLHDIASKLNIDNYGKIELREASLTDEKHRSFMIEVDVVLVNNAGHVFGVRSGNLEGKPTLDECVSGLFAMMKPGARMITFEPLLCLGRSLSDENDMRQKNNLPPSNNASFFTCSKHNIGEKSVGWTDKEIYVHLYTRVREAVFLCCNPKCGWNNCPTAAVDDEGNLIHSCVYCNESRSMNTRKYR